MATGRRAHFFPPPDEEPDPDMDVDTQPPSWKQIVPEKVIKKLTTKEIKRQEFIHELIHTERTHVRNLKVLSKVFYRPMLKFNVMSKQFINQLFPNIDELIKIHVSLMESMMNRQAESEDSVITCIGDVMLKRFDGRPGEIAKDVCATFCSHQRLALEQLKHSQGKDSKLLHQFIANCENDPLCRSLGMEDIILSSYSRLAKYPLLLEGIQKNTPSSHMDRKDIESAIQCTKDLLAYVNQSVKDCQNRQLTPEQVLDVRQALWTLQKIEESKGMSDFNEDECIPYHEELISLRKKAKQLKKATIEAKRVAAQLQLMAGAMDRHVNEIIKKLESD